MNPDLHNKIETNNLYEEQYLFYDINYKNVSDGKPFSLAYTIF